MATILDNKNRNVIPRWRDFRTTVAIGELKSSRQVDLPVNLPKGDYLEKKLLDWKINQTIALAAEIVGTAYVLGRQNEVIDIAKFILNQKQEISQSLKSIAERIINPNLDEEQEPLIEDFYSIETTSLYKRIHNLRQQLRNEPRNSILYVDLARAYTLLDENEKATQAISLALKISPNNRFILRSAARLFLHTKDYIRAHRILRQAEITKYDSWLLAAEISVASTVNNPARFAKTGRTLLSENKLKPLEITELAVALSMLEIENGKTREAKKLIEKAIISPTENSLAQIEWSIRADRIKLDFLDISSFDNVPLVHEAKAWEYYHQGKWKKALNESWQWFYDQPFSERPVDLGSYIASTIIGDYQESIKFLEKGRISNPNDVMVLNNLAFSYASIDDIKNAQKALNEINFSGLDDKSRIIVTATEGLVAFRSGNITKGRLKYLEAMEFAKKLNLIELQTKAYVYYAREEKKAKTIESDEIVKIALKRAETLSNPLIQMIAKRELGKKVKQN